MRYLTKMLYESEFFYKRYRHYSYENYFSNYCLRKTYTLNKKYTNEEAIEWENLKHKEHVDFFFQEYIYFYDELKKILFDENKILKPFTTKFFYDFSTYVEKYYAIKYDAIDKVYSSAKSIENGNFSNEIKELAKLNKKDMFILSINYEKPVLKMIIDDGTTYKTYFFHTIKDWEMKSLFTEDKSRYLMFPLQIKCEEIFLIEDGEFEYNILFSVDSGEIRNSTEDLSIKFTELEIED